MATTDFTNNHLITPELQATFTGHELYSQDGKKKDATCIAVFHIGNFRWYVLEGQQEGNDFILYGIVLGLIVAISFYVFIMLVFKFIPNSFQCLNFLSYHQLRL